MENFVCMRDNRSKHLGSVSKRQSLPASSAVLRDRLTGYFHKSAICLHISAPIIALINS